MYMSVTAKLIILLRFSFMLLIDSNPSVRFYCNFVLFKHFIQFFSRGDPFQVTKHVVAYFAKMVSNVFNRNRVIC